MVASFCFCHLSIIPLRADHSDQSEIVTQMLFGEVGVILKTHNQWLLIKMAQDGYEGWIDHKQVVFITEVSFNKLKNITHRQEELVLPLWTSYGNIHTVKGSVLPSTSESFKMEELSFTWEKKPVVSSVASIVETAMSYLNAPYLWGGRTPFGIDCSGFTQAVYHFNGFQLPRDASQQVHEGKTIEFNDVQPGDLAFFENKKRRIHHVGIILKENKCIHASGQVRIDSLSQQGIIHAEKKELTHSLHCIKRLIEE